jgi:hypothetical protein
MRSIEMQIMAGNLNRAQQRARLLERRLIMLTHMMQGFQKQCEQLPESDTMRQTIQLFIAGVTSVIDGSQDAKVQVAS